MMKLKENSPAFQVVVGPFKGHQYVHGKVYTESQIPPMEMKHFYKVEAVSVETEKPSKPAKSTKLAATKVEKTA